MLLQERSAIGDSFGLTAASSCNQLHVAIDSCDSQGLFIVGHKRCLAASRWTRPRHRCRDDCVRLVLLLSARQMLGWASFVQNLTAQEVFGQGLTHLCQCELP